MAMSCTLVWPILLVTVHVLSAQCCIVENTWTNKSTLDLLDMADVVVYGQDTGHIERSGVNIQSNVINITDCLFKVYCVLKGNVTMKDITIEHISPLTSCSGSRDKLNVGMEMIVALKMTKSGNFKYYEGNVLQSSVYESSAENFRIMNNVTATSEWQIPLDADEDTCKSALEKVTLTTTTTTTTKVTSEPPTNLTVTSTTQAADTAAKVGANLENTDNSARKTELAGHLFFLTLAVWPVCYMCLC